MLFLRVDNLTINLDAISYIDWDQGDFVIVYFRTTEGSSENLYVSRLVFNKNRPETKALRQFFDKQSIDLMEE